MVTAVCSAHWLAIIRLVKQRTNIMYMYIMHVHVHVHYACTCTCHFTLPSHEIPISWYTIKKINDAAWIKKAFFSLMSHSFISSIHSTVHVYGGTSLFQASELQSLAIIAKSSAMD